ncbi:OLC1v1033959C1 [Oldenlandia corymbosa var. corymbosa]|uniref:Protein-lysine N-methyltransferase OLC1_LOCUS7979 n=2 Tax=Magnoliopsida TaxID=3398 RepID=A0AAV1CSE2_OLDCO|nr:OLC1v1033959C1 [Oldenlandia corymbosa var. corymbosa]
MESTTRDPAGHIVDTFPQNDPIEDDDPPMLSSHALEALKEFLSEQKRQESLAEVEEEDVALVTEDWRLSQFWYDRDTAETVAKEVITLCHSLDSPSVACIACPTLYAYLKKFDAGVSAQLLEFDNRFEQYGSEFTFYDYNQPEDLPASLKHSYPIVVADPPYLSKECLEKVSQTISFLSKPGNCYLLLLTGEVQKDTAAELLDLHPCGFRPQHSSKLGNEFRLFTNYNPGTRLGWIVHEDGAVVGRNSISYICSGGCLWDHLLVYRTYTSVLFHGSLLHLMFNMLALVPLGSELERIMGSVRLCYVTILLATSNAVFHLLIAFLVAHNPFHTFSYLMDECAIGFSGILFSMIVIETTLSGVQSRSVFGLFNVPAQWYAWILLVVFQLLMTNVSLLGHLCGILSGFAYTYGLFNTLIPGTSFFSKIESSSLLSSFVRRPKFILCTGGNTSGYIPTHTSQSPTSSGLLSGNLWRSFSSWMPQRETYSQVPSADNDSRFPGTGRTLGSGLSQTVATAPDSTLQARLLENENSTNHPSQARESATGQQITEGRQPTVDNSAVTVTGVQSHQGSAEGIQKLLSMGFEKTQVEVALAAADGDVTVAVEILMSQQG